MSTSASLSLQGCTGAEAFLAGVSPTFWAHVPLFICQIHALILLEEGVNCLVRATADGESPTREPPAAHAVIPISKCKFIGTVVHAERKANGCTTYVIDDGTGLIDCLHWDTEHDDYNGLPSLTGRCSDSGGGLQTPGAVVQVWGRIQCVAVDDCLVEIALPAVSDSRACRRYASAVREIHASLVEPIPAPSRSLPHSLDCERRHWLDCLQTQSSVGAADGSRVDRTLLNPLDVLRILGPDISEQVADRTNLPSAEDVCGLWRVFGVHCRCNNALLQNQLLYCHCIATPEVMDEEFVYRDRLLEALVHAEQATAPEQLSPTVYQREPNENPDKRIEDNVGYFLFQYNSILCHDELNAAAMEQVQRWSKKHQSNQHAGQIQQLIRNTFRALCKDGVLYLLDPDRDVYILLSRSGVLDSYVRQGWSCETAAERSFFYASRPTYLTAVSRARIQLVRRVLTDSTATTIAF